MSEEEEKGETSSAQTGEVAPADEASGAPIHFELNEALWAVVTFETCAARNLTYDEAFRKMEELKLQDISGLCIVTNEAAAKLLKQDD